MPTLTISYQTEAQRRAYEQAIAFVAEIHQLGLDAPAETVVDACEALALGRGRDLIRDSLAAAVQARIDRSEEKKKVTPRGFPADIPAATRGGAGGRC